MNVVHLDVWMKAGDDLHEIRCDYQTRILTIRKCFEPQPGWHLIKEEVAAFSDEKVFCDSEYVRFITDEITQDSIMWFWSDLEAEPHVKKAAAS